MTIYNVIKHLWVHRVSSHFTLTLSEVTKPPKQRRPRRSHSAGRPPIQPLLQPIPAPVYPFMGSQAGWFPPQYAQGQPPGSYRVPLFMTGQHTSK